MSRSVDINILKIQSIVASVACVVEMNLAWN